MFDRNNYVCDQCGKPWHEYIPLKCKCFHANPVRRKSRFDKTDIFFLTMVGGTSIVVVIAWILILIKHI